MKTFTPFAGWARFIELSGASIRLLRGTTTSIGLVLAVLAFGACPAGQAQPLGVNVINSRYSASVSWWGVGGFSSNPDVSGSNSVVSASPTSIDYINQSPSWSGNNTQIWGEADAGLFQSYSFTDTVQGQYQNSFCYVSAISDILFSPLSSQTATLSLQFTGYDNWYQSDCLVTLNDVTSGQVLWNYGWTAFTGAPNSQQFINLPQTDPDDPLSLNVPTAFVASDTYELVMSTDANSNNDNGGGQVRLSGLAAVPEPCPLALAGLAAMLLMFRRVPGWNLSRRLFRPGQ